jgi:hypothetical protein
MSAPICILLTLALAILALIAWLFFSGPDEKALDEQHKSAMPYDSMYVHPKHDEEQS